MDTGYAMSSITVTANHHQQVRHYSEKATLIIVI